MDSVLSIQSLTKFYDSNFKALNQVEFNLKKGEIFGLLGPNGAGKTTLISILTGLLQPTSGTAEIFGFNISKHPIETKKRIGIMPQEIVNHGFFTVREILQFHSGYYGIWNNKQQIDFLLDRLALTEHQNKLAGRLSGGMKRRLLIAKALVHSPPLLLLDEPTAGVDVELRASLWEFVRELNSQGTTILLTTHYLEEAEELCERIGILHQGNLISIGSTSNLIQQMTDRVINITVKSRDILDTLPQNEMTFITGNIIQKKVQYGCSVGNILNELQIPFDQIEDISVNTGTLEEAFVALLEQYKKKEDHE